MNSQIYIKKINNYDKAEDEMEFNQDLENEQDIYRILTG